MAVDFYIANNIDEAERSEEYLSFVEEIHDYLYENKNDLTEGLKILAELAPYEAEILNQEKIRKIIRGIEQVDLKVFDVAVADYLKNKLYVFLRKH